MPTELYHDTISFLISDVARLMRSEFDRRTSDVGIGLTPGEARILVSVSRAGPVRQAVLAERVGLEAMTLSTYLDRLEDRGLLTRTTDPTDRRAKLVQARPEAEPIMKEIGRIGTQLRADMSATINPAQMDQLRQSLAQMRDCLIEMRPECSKGTSKA